MKVSLIISTYNRPDALRLCLESALRQSRMPDEIIVGDDGSGPETRRVVEEIARRSPVPVRHVWQEDRGFRLAASRNKSVAAASGDYIIQLDGDIVMHRKFVADHVSVARRGYYVKGSRVRLTKEFTERVCRDAKFPKMHLFSRGVLRDREKLWRLPVLGQLISRHYRHKGNGQGCNMAFWREDFLRVNGYDEHFVGWGVEDTDLCQRLENAGVRTFKPFRLALCFHLWHNESANPGLKEAYQYLADHALKGEVRCKDGIDKYL